MISFRVYFLYTTFLLVLQFCLSETHLVRHQLLHAEFHHSEQHNKILQSRLASNVNNEAKEEVVVVQCDPNVEDIENTPNAQNGMKKEIKEVAQKSEAAPKSEAASISETTSINEVKENKPKIDTVSNRDAISDTQNVNIGTNDQVKEAIPTSEAAQPLETASIKEAIEDEPKAEPEPNNDITGETHNSHIGSNKEMAKCQFPKDAGLVAITPHAKNAGWAMSPDKDCAPGSYCPYACPPGKVMAQWNPNAKAYTYPQSMDGGLFCDKDGSVKKPFPEKPYCVSGTGVVGAHNKIGKGVAFCQTVLPGSEAMLIPTHVEDKTDLAVPGTNYWCNTAAHYYINPPGVGVEEACVWGNETKPVGNWSPYVAGANTDESGQTFVKVGWNPIFTGSALSSSPPDFGVKIICEKGDCNGTPCSIDPSVSGVGRVQSANAATGAGGANFCVVTVPKGSRANIEVFRTTKAGGKL